MNWALFPFYVLTMRVKTIADGISGETCGLDSFIASYDFGFLIARQLGIEGHVAREHLSAELFVDVGSISLTITRLTYVTSRLLYE
jgi:hypothetical protein